MDSQRRGLKFFILLLAAVVAIGGTIVTSIFQGGYQSRIDQANIHYNLIEGKISQSNQTLQLAIQYSQHATIIVLDRRAYYGIVQKAGELGFSSVYQLKLLWKGNAPESQIAHNTDGAPMGPNPCGVVWNNSNIQDLILAQHCYSNLLANRQYSDQQYLDRLKRGMTRLGVVATVLQMLGIGIAFAKDLW